MQRQIGTVLMLSGECWGMYSNMSTSDQEDFSIDDQKK